MKLRYEHVLLIIFIGTWIGIIGWRLMGVLHNSKTESCPRGFVCLREDDLAPPPSPVRAVRRDYTRERDMRVLNDPLYPALNRTDKTAFEGIVDKTAQREMNVPTRAGSGDTYRLVGYLTNPDDEIKTYKLFARQKDRNRADFYMSPVNAMYDMKVQISDNIVEGPKPRSMDDIPNEIKFKSPLLAETPYVFSELPKADLDSMPYF